jgi:hypothetical protein
MGLGGVVLVLFSPILSPFFALIEAFISRIALKTRTCARNLDASGGRCYIAVSACAFRELLSEQVVEDTPFLLS